MPAFTKIERGTRNEYIEVIQKQAAKDFANHRIRQRDHRSWVCYQKHKDGGWDSIYWFEVVVLFGGTLLVNGDIDLMHFAYYGKYQSPEEVLRWMGKSRDVGYYVLQKAHIGMTPPRDGEGLIEVYNDAVWMDDAFSFIEEELGQKIDLSKEIDLDALPGPEWLRGIIGDVADGSVTDVLADPGALDSDAWDAGVFEWGKVPSTRLIYAHQALIRLVQLLDEEYTEQEKET